MDYMLRNIMKDKNQKIKVIVDDVEIRLLITAFSDLKDKQKLENKKYDFLDDLIVKLCNAREFNKSKWLSER